MTGDLVTGLAVLEMPQREFIENFGVRKETDTKGKVQNESQGNGLCRRFQRRAFFFLYFRC